MLNTKSWVKAEHFKNTEKYSWGPGAIGGSRAKPWPGATGSS